MNVHTPPSPSSPSSAGQLIADHQLLVRRLACRIHRTLPAGFEVDDLVGYGQVGLAEAAHGFDPDRGVRFSTFAYYRVRGAIFDGLSKLGFSRAQRKRQRWAQLADSVLARDAANRDPGESSESEAVDWLRGLTTALAVVYQSTQPDAPEPSSSRAVDSPQDAAMELETTEKLHELLDALPADCSRLLRAVYFDGLTLTAAGERLGVSKAWASRLHARALTRLAGSLRGLGIEG